MKRISGRRKGTGSALVEGVVSLCLVIGGVSAGTILLANTGGALFHKERLAFITNQTATYAASLPKNGSRDAEARTFCDELLEKNGLPKLSSFEIKDEEVSSTPAVRVHISVGNLPLFGNGSLLPSMVSLNDEAVAVAGGGASGGGVQVKGYLAFQDPGKPLVYNQAIGNAFPPGKLFVPIVAPQPLARGENQSEPGIRYAGDLGALNILAPFARPVPVKR